MINAHIGITAATAASPAQLKATGILTAALIQIGRAIAEGDDGARDLIDALEDLGNVANGNVREGRLDRALDDVASLAHLDDAVMDLTAGDVRQLAGQAADALPGGTVVHLLQHDGRWTA